MDSIFWIMNLSEETRITNGTSSKSIASQTTLHIPASVSRSRSRPILVWTLFADLDLRLLWSIPVPNYPNTCPLRPIPVQAGLDWSWTKVFPGFVSLIPVPTNTYSGFLAHAQFQSRPINITEFFYQSLFQQIQANFVQISFRPNSTPVICGQSRSWLVPAKF